MKMLEKLKVFDAVKGHINHNNMAELYYPINKKKVKRYLKSCEQWHYGNKDTCKYVTEQIIQDIELDRPDLTIRETLYQDLVGIIHDINSGGNINQISTVLIID